MSRHSNAIGHLIELRDQESVLWFSQICDHAISSDGRALEKGEIQTLINILFGNEHYTPITASPITTTTSTTLPHNALSRHHLKNICDFSNFKSLSSDLKLVFDRRVTLIFGCNGSGKSSLCEAIKVLASPENPQNPLTNVRARTSQPCSFNYLFNDELGHQRWDISKGYGSYSNHIKFFDSTIAIQNITGTAVPERTVKIEPFRLEVFKFAGQYVRQLNDYLTQVISKGRDDLAQKIDLIATKFEDVISADQDAIANISTKNCKEIDAILESHTQISVIEKTKYKNDTKSLKSLKRARSIEGLKLQQTELQLLLEYGHSIQKFIKIVTHLSLKKAIDLAKNIDSLLRTQSTLANNITPDGIDSKDFEGFIKASQKIFNFGSSEPEKCPFCRRILDEQSIELAKSYHTFLLDEIGARINSNSSDLKKIFSSLKKVKTFSLHAVSQTLPISQELREKVSSCIRSHQNMIPNSIDDLVKSEHTGFGELKDLTQIISIVAREVLLRYRSIKLSSASEDVFEKKCNKLESKILGYEYKKRIDDNISELKVIITSIKKYNTLEDFIQVVGFSNFLRKVTNKGKEAYRDLVVAEFKKSVDDEYKRMSGQKMSDFGISLTSTAADQNVIVNTKIGDEPINRVLSEGEQKIHALALFFSEASVSDHHVVVFDDPVTSFDYNYSSRTAERLRDYIKDNPDIQVILLTHNWDFFVHMQIVLNQSMLNLQLSVKILEHCCLVEEYSEKVDELKQDIISILAVSGEPSGRDKDRLAGYQRRLIESVINKRVFNGQRHQFKQTSMAVSAFTNYTKIVPLHDLEALKLRDLYRNLSVPEHEDPRNYYSLKSKAMYQQYYDEILSIERDLISRRP